MYLIVIRNNLFEGKNNIISRTKVRVFNDDEEKNIKFDFKEEMV